MEDMEPRTGEKDVQRPVSPAAETPRNLPELQRELARVEQMIDRLSTLMEKPGLDLASAMRLSMYRSELIAYCKGMEYAAGRQPEFVALPI